MNFKSILCFCLVIIVIIIESANAYTVVGNKIKDPSGKEVLLRGVCRPSTEWNEVGENIGLNDYKLMVNNWKANVIRLSLNQDWYLAKSSYRQFLAQQVTTIKSLGAGVIFDLHWNSGNQQQNMADANSITFWSQMATQFKSDPWVIFELYNEPHDVSWADWLNGPGGMQKLYNAVRNAGADNMVIVNGLDWAYNLAGVISKQYRVNGVNIAYGTHPYNFDGKKPANWDSGFGNLVPEFPVIMTEFGQYCANDNYVADLLAYANRKGIHWTAWAWYVQGCGFPSVISDWSGTPSEPVGKIVHQFLTGGSSFVPPTEAPVTPASNPLTIYSDSLNSNFEDISWSTDRSLSDTTRAKSGSRSIKFALKAYEAIYFNALSSGSYFKVGAYASLSFYAYSATWISKENLGVIIYVNKLETSNVLFPVDLQAGQWTLINIPVTSFAGIQNTAASGLAIQCKTSSNLGYVWIDDITFTTKNGGSATTASATTKVATATTASATTKIATATTASATTKVATATTASATTGKSSTTGSGSTTGASVSTIPVYVDGVAQPFQDWSWMVTRNAADSTVKNSGSYSYSFTPQSYAAIFFYNPNIAVDTSKHSAITFYVNGGTAGGQRVAVVLIRYDSVSQQSTIIGPDNDDALITKYIGKSSIPANQWVKGTVPLSAYPASSPSEPAHPVWLVRGSESQTLYR